MLTNYIEIDIDKIIGNIEKIHNINKDVDICAVVKANAYGLGAVPIAKHIEKYVSYFAVARFEEARSLRYSGIKKPILVLGYVSPQDVKKCLDLDIDISIYDLSLAKEINNTLDEIINCHLAIDTGHSRIGFRFYELDKIRELKSLKNLNIKGIFSHFSTADEKDLTFTKDQERIFSNVLRDLEGDFKFDLVHIDNSAGFIRLRSNYDMARIGIAMYGLYPSDYMRERKDIYLEPCFKFKSIVSHVKEIDEGTSVSYGRSFIADKKMKIATIPVGYADGYFRAFSNLGEVLIKGSHARVVGRVCMDQIMVDVSNIDVNIGDEVIFYDDIYIEANKIATIPYELMTALDMRIPRLYIKNDKVVEVDDYLGEIYED